MRQAKHWQMKVSPDVLVIPSKMTPIVKEVAGDSMFMCSA
jgi:hypothetical protein